jgi:hypothetical protein
MNKKEKKLSKTNEDRLFNVIYIAFFRMLEEDGMFGIKPSEYWIKAMWQKDFLPKIKQEFNKRFYE